MSRAFQNQVSCENIYHICDVGQNIDNKNMKQLLVILILIKFNARKNIFNIIYQNIV